jgi:hypothetical protein
VGPAPGIKNIASTFHSADALERNVSPADRKG